MPVTSACKAVQRTSKLVKITSATGRRVPRLDVNVRISRPSDVQSGRRRTSAMRFQSCIITQKNDAAEWFRTQEGTSELQKCVHSAKWDDTTVVVSFSTFSTDVIPAFPFEAMRA